jgi:hypothetical protein
MTTTTETILGTLTHMDIKALRQCDRVAISHSETNVGMLRFVKAVEKRGPFDETEVSYELPCRSSVCDYVGEGCGVRPRDTKFRCFDLVYNYTHTESSLATCGAFVRAGDVVSLEWVGSSNGYTREAGLHLDTVSIAVKRGDKKYIFPVATSCCPNNSARMIKVA